MAHQKLSEMGLPAVEPRGAFYIFPNITSTGLSDLEFCERLLSEERVAVIPGSAFGESGRGFVRICYAAAYDDIEEAMSRISRFVDRRRAELGDAGDQ
jgi:aminotransferase